MARRVSELLKTSVPLELRSLRHSLTPESMDAAREYLFEVTSVADAYDTDVAAAMASPDFTEQGRRKEIERITRGYMSELAGLEAKKLPDLREGIANMEGAVLGRARVQRPTDAGERLAYELRARKIRDMFRSLDPLQTFIIYMGTTDPEIIDALESGPGRMVRADRDAPPTLQPFIDPERRAVAMLERARRAAPEQAAILERLQTLERLYSSAIETVRTEMLSAVPALAPDPIAAQAAGA